MSTSPTNKSSNLWGILVASIATLATVLFLALVLLLSRGCQPASVDSRPMPSQVNGDPSVEPASPNWDELIQAVAKGQSDSIRTSSTVNEANQFERLADLTNLRELVLDEGVVGDDDLARFIQRVQLNHLRLRHSPITDRSMRLIADSQKELRILNLPQCQITLAGMEAIGSMQSLTHLRLGCNRIDDPCITAISGLANLQSLHLIGPRMTGASLQEIAKLKNLQSFYLDDCKIADADWQKFFVARPDVHVHIDQAHHDRDPRSHDH